MAKKTLKSTAQEPQSTAQEPQSTAQEHTDPTTKVSTEPTTTKGKRGKKGAKAPDAGASSSDNDATPAVVENGSVSSGDDNTATTKRHIRSPLERVELLISLLSGTKVNKAVMNELALLHKHLDGAKIKVEKRSRPANAYNLFMQEQMKELGAKSPDKKPSEVFAECIKKWNKLKEEKEQQEAEDAKAGIVAA